MCSGPVQPMVQSRLPYFFFRKTVTVNWEEWHQQGQEQSQLQTLSICTVPQTEISGVVHGEQSCSGCISWAVILWPLTASLEHLWKQDRSRVHLKKRQKQAGWFYAQISHPDTQSRCDNSSWKHCTFGLIHGVDGGNEIITASHAFQIYLI